MALITKWSYILGGLLVSFFSIDGIIYYVFVHDFRSRPNGILALASVVMATVPVKKLPRITLTRENAVDAAAAGSRVICHAGSPSAS